MEYFLIFIAAFSISSIICFIIYSFIVTFPLEFKYEERPLLFLVYLKAFWLSLKRKQTSKIQHLFSKNGSTISRECRITVIARDCRIDKSALQYYASVCGYPDDCQFVPPCYLENYFVALATVLVTSDQFMINPLGLIHMSQSFTQHTGLEHLLKEPFDVECSLAQYRATESGIELDIVMHVYDRREMCVWESTNTILSRNIDALKKDRENTPCSDFEEEDNTRKHERIVLDMPSSLGRQFAWASGDWNLQHLWQWTAKIVDFSQPSVHGMWSLARCLAHLQCSGLFLLAPPFHVSARFKKPIFLPGSSVFTFMRQTDKDLLCFKVEDSTTSAPQLVAHVRRK